MIEVTGHWHDQNPGSQRRERGATVHVASELFAVANAIGANVYSGSSVKLPSRSSDRHARPNERGPPHGRTFGGDPKCARGWREREPERALVPAFR